MSKAIFHLCHSLADEFRIYRTAMLWVDKHRPASFDALIVHSNINECLRSLARSEDLPHLLITGPSGAGKVTRIRALLNELYGPGAAKMKMEEKVFVTPSSRKIEMTVFGSAFHVEMCPSDVGIYDRVVVQEIIKEIAQSPPLDKTRHSFKVVVIMDADRLTKDAQHGLRRTMEKYSGNLRLIMCGTSASRVIGPIRSRCMAIRIPAPSDPDIRGILERIARSENVVRADSLIDSALSISNGNVRRAVLAMEAAVSRNVTVAERPDWESCIATAADQICKEQTATSLLAARNIFYDLLTHCIPAGTIMDTLAALLVNRIKSGSLCAQVLEAAAFYDHRAVRGTKDILHLEAFAARTMAIIASSR